MRKLLPVLGILVFMAAIGIIAYNYSAIYAVAMSNGAPQLECIQCHAGADQNPAEFTIEGLPETYEPGQTYKITVKILSGPDCSGGVACGGFAVQVSGGQLIVVDETNTFMSTTPLGEELLTHTKDGSLKREWSFEWKAPDTPEPVTFKIAVIAANGDGSFQGDSYGYKEITIEPATTTGEATPTETPTPTPTTTVTVIEETVTKTIVKTVEAGKIMEYDAALAVGIAIAVFAIVVGGYFLLTRK